MVPLLLYSGLGLQKVCVPEILFLTQFLYMLCGYGLFSEAGGRGAVCDR